MLRTLDILLALEALMLLAVVLFLLLRGRRDPIAWHVVALTLPMLLVGTTLGWFGLLPPALAARARLTLFAVAAAAFLGIGILFPGRAWTPRTRALWCLAVAPGAAALAGAFVPALWEATPLGSTYRGWLLVYVQWGELAAIVLLALRWRAARERASRTQLAVILAAFAVWAFNDGIGYVLGGAPDGRGFPPLVPPLLFVGALLALGVLAAVALAAAARAVLARAPREGALAVAIVAAAALSFVQLAFASAHVAHGVHLVVDALFYPVVAYGAMRHRILDIDLRLKWTLRRGTVAFAFLAVFFIAGQLAETYLSDRHGLAAGGVAAGLLLFAIHPLQRIAERVADTAMPGVRDTADYRAQRRLELYRGALRLALLDGTLDREEERHLAALATELGIDAAQALALREDVERELAAPVVLIRA